MSWSSKQMDELADSEFVAVSEEIDRHGGVIEVFHNDTMTHENLLVMTGSGRKIAGCCSSVLDAMGVCLRDHGCPSASFAHPLFNLTVGKPDAWSTGYVGIKLCPVLLADALGAFQMRDKGGVK